MKDRQLQSQMKKKEKTNISLQNTIQKIKDMQNVPAKTVDPEALPDSINTNCKEWIECINS